MLSISSDLAQQDTLSFAVTTPMAFTESSQGVAIAERRWSQLHPQTG